MNKKWLLSILGLLLLSCNSNQQISSSTSSNTNQNTIVDYDSDREMTGDQFDFKGNYTKPELTVDGKDDEEQWKNSTEYITFGQLLQAKVKMFRGESALYCYFVVEDEDIQTVGENNGDDVTKGDSVEIYFDFKNDAASKPQNDDIQINIGAHGKTRIFVGSNGQWGSWNGLLDYEVVIDGTLNDDKDVDQGYAIELMIPYEQVGIDKNSIFGFSLGHVARGRESTHDTLAYTWGGISYEGNFIDPQSPATYLVLMGNDVYSRSNVPMDNIEVKGTIKDPLGQVISDVKVELDGKTCTTGSDGKYEFSNIDPNKNATIKISKNGYKTYEKNLMSTELKSTLTGTYRLDLVIIDIANAYKTKLIGLIKNPSEGLIGEATINVGEKQTTSKSDGSFELEIEIDNDLEIVVSKDNYRLSNTKLDASLLKANGTTDLQTIALYSPSSKFNFGGARGITPCQGEVYRGFDGIHFTFCTPNAIINGDQIELFIDTGISFSGRDSSDYLIKFNGDGGITITNYGGGNNDSVSKSGIKNNPYLKGTSYYIEALIPYSFLKVEPNEIVGFSCGVFSQKLSDWDGWNFKGAGFNDYVAPEYTDQYCRIGLDNGLYRASNNQTYATKIYGKVTDSSGVSIIGASINGSAINEDGTYSFWFTNDKDVTLNVSANGYISQTINISKTELNSKPINKDIVLNRAVAVISGTCNAEGAKVYYQSDPTIFTFVENGNYSIEVPTDKNATLIFECDGYLSVKKAIGKAALIQSAQNGTPCVFNCVMEQA